MSYVINYEAYKPQFLSKDEDVIKNALQRLYESFTQGQILYKTDASHFCSVLAVSINSKSKKIRKWAYHCATYYSNKTIIKLCRKQLLIETNSENIIWNISVLATECNNINQLKSLIPTKKYDEFYHTISPFFLEISSLLSTDYEDFDIKKIAEKTNRKAELMTSLKLYGYPSLSKNYRIEQNYILNLHNHEDSDVREYSFWALFKNSQRIDYSLITYNLTDTGNVLKWKYAVSVLENDEDRIEEFLKIIIRNKDIQEDVRKGIAIGLQKAKYHNRYVPYIAKWLNNENELYIRQLLLQYIVNNCRNNYLDGTFIDLLNRELNCDDSLSAYIIQIVKNNQALEIEIINNDKLTIKMKEDVHYMESIIKENNGYLFERYDIPQNTITVLFLAANPIGTNKLSLDSEARLILEKIKLSLHRDALNFETRWAVRASDLLQAINDTKPTIIHFSGHGTNTGDIILLDDAEKPKAIKKEAISAAIATAASFVKLVVFNTCYSESQTKKAVENIDAAIGMSDSIGDKAACTFSAQLYSSIGFGLSLKQAFDQARAELMLEGIPEENTPVLYVKKDKQAENIYFIKKR